jgi:leader peptidase (prepilin peptidase)/N-methyltransferase
VFSFLIQRAKCRECKTKMSPQYLLMELLCGGGTLWAFMALGISRPAETIIGIFLFPVLVSLSVEDIKKTEIPYWCSGAIAVLGVTATILSFFPSVTLGLPWYEHLIGAVIISVPFAVFCFLGAMGGGDVHLTAAAGLLLGWAIVPAVLIGMLIGGVVGIIIKMCKKSRTICFGPFLSLGIAVGYIYGYELIGWYVGMFW